jgi:hypothetical protein
MNRLRFVVDAEGNVLSFELVGARATPIWTGPPWK